MWIAIFKTINIEHTYLEYFKYVKLSNYQNALYNKNKLQFQQIIVFTNQFNSQLPNCLIVK